MTRAVYSPSFGCHLNNQPFKPPERLLYHAQVLPLGREEYRVCAKRGAAAVGVQADRLSGILLT